MPEIIGYKKVINTIIDLDAEYITNEIAKLCGLSQRQIQREIRAGNLKIPRYKAPRNGGQHIIGKEFVKWLKKYYCEIVEVKY
jgi:transcriptional antiterminator